MDNRFIRQEDHVDRAALAEVLCHVVGVGATGRQVGRMLAAQGAAKAVLYDHDKVEVHNVPTQLYTMDQVGKPKVQVTRHDMLALSPDIQVDIIQGRWPHTRGAYFKESRKHAFFSCVDSMSGRSEVWETINRGWEDAGEPPFLVVDSRMLGEHGSIYVTQTPGDPRYENSLFDDSEAEVGACTGRSTAHCAQVTASLMVTQLFHWLKDMRIIPEMVIDLSVGMVRPNDSPLFERRDE